MAGFSSGKMKRKDLEDVYDEFSEFSLSSPARKIRRLDAELTPIMEEEPAAPLLFKQQFSEDQMIGGTSAEGSVMPEGLPALPSNDERALVPYKPRNDPLILTPSSYRVVSDLIPILKNQAFWQGSHDQLGAMNDCLALVPWVPSQSPVTTDGVQEYVLRGRLMEEEMEAEGIDGMSMEVEEERGQAVGSQPIGGEGFHQWQQHCMIPQFLPNTSTPIMWSQGLGS